MNPLPQLSIFTGAPFSNPDTSRDAAKAIEPKLYDLERRVLWALRDGPLCDLGIQQFCEMSGDTERPRRVALVGRGLVEQVRGDYEMLPSGRRAKLWRLTLKGREAIK